LQSLHFENKAGLVAHSSEDRAIVCASRDGYLYKILRNPIVLSPFCKESVNLFLTDNCSSEEVVLFSWENSSTFMRACTSHFISQIKLILDQLISAEFDKVSESNIDTKRWSLPYILASEYEANITSIYVPRYRRLHSDLYIDPWPLVVNVEFPIHLVGFDGRFSRSPGLEGGPPGVDRGGYGGSHGNKAKDQPDERHPGLTVGEPDDGIGGVRRTGLLDEIICLQAVLLSGFGAAVAFVRGFPARDDEPRKPRWIAAGAAGLVTGLLFLKPLVTGQIWLPWL
jgi:hypothetical protein